MICLDVGGTFTKGSAFSKAGNSLLSGVAIYESVSNSDARTIVTNLVNIIEDIYFQLLDRNYQVIDIGLAFPGPFDYEDGVSKIRGLGKFDALYNVNIKEAIREVLVKSTIVLKPDFTIFFANDAKCFAFGEYLQRERGIESGGYFTLGTGFGSTFIENGTVLKGVKGLPESGMLFSQPFRGGVLDDYLSARGLTKIVYDIYGKKIELKEVSNYAKNFDFQAIEAFRRYGCLIAEALIPIIRYLNLDELVFGGQISKSFVFFRGELDRVLKMNQIKIQLRTSKDTSLSTMKGLYYLKNGGNKR